MLKEPLEYKFYKFSVLTFLMMLSAINFNVFISQAKIVAGGVNGISVIAENLLSLSPTIIIFTISISILIFGLIFSEYELVISALYTSLIYPIFVGITSNLGKIILISSHDMIVISIFSGIISGIVSGIVCKLNTSQGGIILISQIISKRKKTTVTKINLLLNVIIILFGGLTFGVENILYALIFIISSKTIMDKVMLGTSREKLFQIITPKEKEITYFIENTLNSKYTIFEVDEPGTKKCKNVIMTLVPTIDYFKLKERIKEIDSNAFILISDAYESKVSK